MLNKKFMNVDQVVSWRLCLGCGACEVVCEGKAISLVDIYDDGIRPRVDAAKCKECGNCVSVCPGIELSQGPLPEKSIPELSRAWGGVLEVWEGYAKDPELRFKGSSGGVATALAYFCLQEEKMAGVLETGADPEAPWQNIPVLSKDKTELINCTGSRYSPAGPCQRLDWIAKTTAPCVFIGKPCDVAALRKLQKFTPSLNDKIGLTIGIFCAGTPSSKGTKELLDTLGVPTDQVEELRYRGCGWPGSTTVQIKGGDGRMSQMSYEESWGGILSNYTQFRCRLCPDSTGEFADISCGDPWYKEAVSGDPGQSLVLVRTEKGRRILQRAMQSDYVVLQRVEPSVVPRSQKSLLNRKRHLFGRLLTMRLMRVPAPRYMGFSLFANWCSFSLAERLRSIIGTLGRIITRKWYRQVKAFDK